MKKEKEYKNELIEKMKEQINEKKQNQKVVNENKKLKKELKQLKASTKPNDKILTIKNIKLNILFFSFLIIDIIIYRRDIYVA